MTVKYNYKCVDCGAVYLEQRAKEQPQFFTDCQTCGVGTYEETSVEVISETIEVVAAPEIAAEPTTESNTDTIE